MIVDEAARWLGGDGDLLIAGLGQPVPTVVQVAVLAHADLDRLAWLGCLRRRGSVRRSWGTPMAALAGEIAAAAVTPERLRFIQRNLLVPMELQLLDDPSVALDRRDVIERIRSGLQYLPPQA